jgi:hypothetical protein
MGMCLMYQGKEYTGNKYAGKTKENARQQGSLSEEEGRDA